MANTARLYHGTNTLDDIYLDIDGIRIVDLHRKWTTHPGEAMNFAFDSVTRYGGEMFVLIIPEYDLSNFRLTKEPSFPYGRTENGDVSSWHELNDKGRIDCRNPDSLEQRTVEVYYPDELERFIEEQCQNKDRERTALQSYLTLLREKYRKT